jgi:hypothetical protein
VLAGSLVDTGVLTTDIASMSVASKQIRQKKVPIIISPAVVTTETQ